MNHRKELRIDVFLYFLVWLSTTNLNFWPVVTFTIFFALRMWYPDILDEIQREIEREPKKERATMYSEEVFFSPSENNLNFEDVNDFPAQDEEKEL